MQEEAKQVIAFIFKRSGKKTLPASDVYLAISMELQWCSPKEAKMFVKEAVIHGLLIEEKQGITPSFPVDTIEIPTGFIPSKDCFVKMDSLAESAKNIEILNIVVSRVKQKTKKSEEEIKKEIQEIASQKLIYEEIAAVFYAKKMDIKIDDLLDEVEKINVTSGKNKA
jgi:hypothetical protein